VEAGYDIQFINWTKDVNKYLESLSHLSFNGNDLNQSTMAEGLAEALVVCEHKFFSFIFHYSIINLTILFNIL
jgi:hypothetical protein